MKPNIQEGYVDPKTGRLTIEGYKLLADLDGRLEAQAALIAAQAVIIADHEARIEALEP